MASSSSQKQPISARPSSSAAGSSSSGKGKLTTTGDDMLDALVEVFPQLNFLTLVEVCMEYKDDIDGAADYIIHNVLPSILDNNNANANEDSHIKVDNDADSVQSDIANKYTPEEKSLVGENSDFLVAGALKSKPEASAFEDDLATQVDGSDEEKDSLMGENSDCLIVGALNSKPETSFFEDDLSTQDDELPGMATQSVYPITLESLDNAIAEENYKKVTLMSNVTTISQMLEEVNLKEEKSKQAVLESTQAGNDIFVKVEEFKEMTMLAAEENDKVAAEAFAEQSILASEANGLQARLSNISEESNNYFLIIDEMCRTLQVRRVAAELEIILAEGVKIERETLARKMLKEQELLVDSTKERSKKLEQQVKENAKLRELLMDQGQVVDALQGEMVGIFDKISQLQLTVQGSSSMSRSANSADNIAELQCLVDEPQHSVDESLQLASPRLPSSFKFTDSTVQAHYTVDEPQLLVDENEPLQHYTVDEPQVPVDEPLLSIDELLQLASSISSNSLKSADNIAQLLGRVLDVHFPVDESPELASSSLSNLAKSSDNIVPFQKKVDVDESLQLPPYSLVSSKKLAASKSSWSSAVESNSVFSGDKEIDDASSHDNFPLDDTWDVVVDEAIYMCAN